MFIAVVWGSLLCFLLVFSLYWNYLTTDSDRLHRMYAFFPHSTMPYFAVFLLLVHVIYLIIVGYISKRFLSSILVLSISLLVFCWGCKYILNFLFIFAYPWSLGECSCALKLGWIQLCCFGLLFCISSFIPIHIESAVSAYPTHSLMEISLCL